MQMAKKEEHKTIWAKKNDLCSHFHIFSRRQKYNSEKGKIEGKYI